MNHDAEEIAASHVLVHTADRLDILGFSEHEDGKGKYLLLQRSRHFDEQDRALGMDKVHIEISDASRSCYGGILEVVVSDDRMIFTFDDRASAVLRVNQRLVVRVDGALLASTRAADRVASMCAPDGAGIIRR